MRTTKNFFRVAIAIFLMVLALQFMAENAQPISLVTLLGVMPSFTVGQIALGSWLVGMAMGLVWMRLWMTLRARANSCSRIKPL